MGNYQRILVALELNPACDQLILNRVKEIYQKNNATHIFLIHAIEYLWNYGIAYGLSTSIDVEESLTNEAQLAMSKIADELNIPSERLILELGHAKVLILDHAEKINANLIVVGSHGRHGVRLLLGSTANAVLHHAKCDVLAVRVYE